MKKSKYFLIFIIILFSVGTIDILSKSFSIFGISSKIFPDKYKNLVKEKLFFIPHIIKSEKLLSKKVTILDSNIENSKNNINDIYSLLKANNSNLQISYISKKKLMSKNGNYYSLTLYSLPFLNYINSDGKPAGYLEKNSENLIIVSGDGMLFYIHENKLNKKKINMNRINTNLNNFNFFDGINKNGYLSIRDVEIHKSKIYLSVINEIEENCFNLEIVRADLDDLQELEFEMFFSIEECISKNEFVELNLGQSGGRIVFYDNNLIFTTGGFRTRVKPQDDNSLYGKTLAIDLKNNFLKIISKGHRNAQGLAVFENTIISTEHGPQGGDEVNILGNIFNNGKILNFGWPISSYGKHYPNVVRLRKSRPDYDEFVRVAPLHKSHKEYGFVEPIKYYSPESIAISEIEFSNPNFDKNFTNDVFYGALRNSFEVKAKIYHLKFDEKFQKIVYEDELLVEQRIRDIKIPKEDNKMYLILESVPYLGIIEKIN